MQWCKGDLVRIGESVWKYMSGRKSAVGLGESAQVEESYASNLSAG